MNPTKQLSTLGHGARHTNRDASAEHNRELGRANYEAAQVAIIPQLLAELRAHGNLARACATAGTSTGMLWDWRERDAALDRDVKRAMQFAKSDAVDYAAWVVQL